VSKKQIVFEDLERYRKRVSLPALNPAQLEFVRSTHPFTLGSGGFGSGKTTALVLRCMLMGSKSDWFGDLSGNELLIGRYRMLDFKKTTLVELKRWMPSAWIRKEYKNEGIIELVNNTTIHYTHLETFEHLQSYNLGHAFVDQSEQIDEPTFKELAYARVRLKTLRRLDEHGNQIADPVEFTNQGVSMVCNTKRGSFLYPRFVVNELYGLSSDDATRVRYNPDYKLITISTLENVKNLPKGYIERQQRDKSAREFARDVMGDWSKFEGQVYDDLTDANIHNENLIPKPEWPIYVGIDHGGSGVPTPNNSTGITAVLFIAYEERSGSMYPRCHVFDELYLPASTIEETVGAIDSRLKAIRYAQERIYGRDEYRFGDSVRADVEQWRCDPSMARRAGGDTEETIMESYMNHAARRGMTMPLAPGSNDVTPGIHRVNWMLRKVLLMINPRCVNLLNELRSVEYGNNEKPKAAQADHATDTLRYILSAVPMWFDEFTLPEDRQSVFKQVMARQLRDRMGDGFDPVYGRFFQTEEEYVY